MKAALNGRSSIEYPGRMGGWKDSTEKNGWAVEHDGSADDPDSSDAEKIYSILEGNVIPLYYNMSENGVPHDWVKLMKASMKSAASGFSARRMVKEYVEKFYAKRLEGVLKSLR